MANQFMRGEVYWCDFPRRDLNHPKPIREPDHNLYGRHMAVVLTNSNNPYLDQDRVLVVPISTISSLKYLEGKDLYLSYVPVSRARNAFLAHDSYAKTNQIQSIDRRLMIEKVGKLHHDEMMDIYYSVVNSTGTYRYVEVEVVRRIMDHFRHHEIAVTEHSDLHSRREHDPRDFSDTTKFRRGDIVIGHFPRFVQDEVSNRYVQGDQLAICLTNYFDRTVPSGQVLVVPLVREQTNPKSMYTISSHDYPVLKGGYGLYYADVGQIQPLNRHWITQRLGRMKPTHMQNLDILLLKTLGMEKYVERLIDTLVSRKIAEIERSRFGKEKTHDLDR